MTLGCRLNHPTKAPKPRRIGGEAIYIASPPIEAVNTGKRKPGMFAQALRVEVDDSPESPINEGAIMGPK